MTKLRFDTIRAFSIRPGDQMPEALPTGQWDKSRAYRVVDVSSNSSVTTIKLEGGKIVKALSMNQVPFISGSRWA